MTIKIFNPSKLTLRPFFQQLIAHLASHEDVTLRKLKATFPTESQLERQIEDFVQAGLILRADKRYTNHFKVFGDRDFDLTLPATAPKHLVFDHPFFVKEGSELMYRLQRSRIQQSLTNQTNAITLHLSSDFEQTEDNLANYFDHVAQRVPLTPLERQVFALIGDVDPNYALKYMTTFLLKFAKKEVVKQKRPDIFVQTLETYGYLVKNDEASYRTNLTFEDQTVETIVFDDAHDFIAAQIRQVECVASFVKIG
ncbi:MAG: DUF1803 domain-containing protein [Streptococcaceae bacterium]|jgi:hypothetical protein|nr:DUF1803 domain-containing protein [Streptococcaceae bacterium]